WREVWDQGLLLNAAVGGVLLMPGVDARLGAAGVKARAYAVDKGLAFNRAPHEGLVPATPEPSGTATADAATVDPATAPAEGEGAGASSEPVVRTVRRTSVELFDAEGPAPAGQGYVTRTAYDVERVAGGPDAGTRVTVKLALRPEEGATPDHLAS